MRVGVLGSRFRCECAPVRKTHSNAPSTPRGAARETTANADAPRESHRGVKLS